MKEFIQHLNIQGGNVSLRLVNDSDAEFILRLRTDDKLAQNISWTSSKINKQIKWIKEYKQREKENREFYFIFEDSNYKPWGTVRLYEFTEESFTIGSWICLQGNNENIAIKAWLLSIEFAFEELNYNICKFDIRKKNKSVLYYAKLYNPTLIVEDDLNFYFRLNRDTYYKNRERVIKLLNIKI